MYVLNLLPFNFVYHFFFIISLLFHFILPHQKINFVDKKMGKNGKTRKENFNQDTAKAAHIYQQKKKQKNLINTG